ncbi:PIF1-like helicase domain-containing protein [Hirsutella rhossiliensis]|uniref:ATP-dependent DNA helicase n=1 Tax=Hirsutella rhossiliensis TaxID=111463 RepID=A0A9P8MUE4_9HYPO|nr:PIF1-like helicase domain-containing protein [Hirsutella rhossiliensis]KAH0961252.1 PIF1-like helicase domain-containing protein [Hirsutella rhossiliensis]
MAEEMLIARVHVHVKVLQVRGAQYKYRGHVVHFLRNVGRHFEELPVLPEELDIVLLRPPNVEGDPRFRQQFARDFRVVEEDPSDADASAIPNLQVTDTELNALQSRFLDGTPNPERMTDLEYMPRSAQTDHQMPLPSIRRTPIDEFNRSQPLLTLAFPTLYPDGKADFVEPRLRSITYQDYLGHAMRWHDGRFARHKTWPFVALNTMLQEAMAEPDEPEAQALIQSITRQAAVIRGTRPPGLFVTAKWKAAPEAARMVLSRQLLRDNAHIAAYHFHKRYTLFRTIVLKQKFNLTDFWGRYEWGERNDGQVNHYNRLLTVAWLANTDVSPCTSLQQVIDYAAKYCSKSEKKSESFAQIGKALMPRVKDHNPLISFASKLLNQLVAERDYSKQEEDLDLLGRRDIDVNYDWTRHVGTYPELRDGYWKDLIASHPMANDVEVLGPHWRNTLNPQQRLVYDTFMGHFQAQILLKSFSTLMAVVAQQPPYRILALFAAWRQQALRSRLRHVKYLVIDEKSMLGLEQLARIDSRLRQVFPQRSLEFFGGVSVLLVGDFFQLPPVRQKPLYSTSTSLSSLERRGQVAYRLFDRTVFLTTVQRQVGDDQAQFRQALQELREARLTQSEVDGFRTALRVYSTKARVEAKNQGNGAGQASSDSAGNLSNKFPVAKGTRVMLTTNLWQPAGLVNGAQDPPAVIMVDFDSYDGPPYLTTNEGRKISPILPSLTKDQIVTDLATRDFQAGISYVAVSRVTSLQGLLLEAPFDRQSLYNHTPAFPTYRVHD